MINNKKLQNSIALIGFIFFLFIAIFIGNANVHAASTSQATAPNLDIVVPEKINLEAGKDVAYTVKSNNGIFNLVSLSVNATNGWQLVSKDTDFAKMNKDSKKFSIVADGTHDMTTSYDNLGEFSVGKDKTVNLKTQIGATSGLNDEKVADIVVTVEKQLKKNTITTALSGRTSRIVDPLFVEKILFTDEVAPQEVEVTDFSATTKEMADKLGWEFDIFYIGWFDEPSATLKISSQKNSEKVRAGTSINNAFRGFENVVDIDLSKLNMDYIHEMNSAFEGLKNLKAIDLSHMNSKSFAYAKRAFCGCDSLKVIRSPKVIHRNVDSRESTTKDFWNAKTGDYYPAGEIEVGLAGAVWVDTKPINVNIIGHCFYGEFEWLDDNDKLSIKKIMFTDEAPPSSAHPLNYSVDNDGLRAWIDENNSDILKIAPKNLGINMCLGEDASDMFGFFDNLENVDFSNLNMSKLKHLENMFSACDYLKTIDLSKVDLRGVNDIKCINSLFNGCDYLKEIYTPKNIPANVDTTKVTTKDFWDADTGEHYPAGTFPTGNAKSIHLVDTKPTVKTTKN